ncbi:MAG: 50S ribosomal protein L18 [Pseudomonadota bacterium]
MAISKAKTTKSRASRTRRKISRVSKGRPRLSVFRSAKNISAQVIDDAQGKTLASASSLDKELSDTVGKGSDAKAAAVVGKIVAERALKAGVSDVVFDRGAYLFHGRVKALADAAREAGLKF